ncbi:MAG: FKBP-type peptidyl-prolyl cis-trans isomerase [Pedobacter sp.]|nr:FKBP-type peptidyl-prolyl cis-trans isomerase [Pedobacter sp.]MDQ8053545.1 FKBP-type peptidyl-prolyl cis-trans isomerase [Pedobacter sp.]
MKKSLVILLAATLGLAACNREKKGPGGLLYTIHHTEGKEKIQVGDVIKMHYIQKNDKDSLLLSTYDNELAQVFPVPAKTYAGDINDVLTMFGEGDSATFKINLDTMAAQSKQPKPEQFKNDKYMTFTVKIEKVFKKKAGEADSTFQKRASEFFQSDYKATFEKIKNAEPAKIDAYLKDKNLKTTTTPSGLHYVINAPGDSQHPAITDTLMVKYTGSLTKKNKDGKYKVFDTSDDKIAKENNVFQVGRPYGPTKMALAATVPGFAEGLQLIGKGGKITLIVPSKLGWGEQGSPQVGITPYSPVAFDVEIIDIIKPKPGTTPAVPVPAPAKK